ncbi:uncharacterized protein E0L32_006058 [Thyridium curvatum]|uniref:Zn(2)-C6 fungal-type domain-containing protein n=1 Tax=Thyridium curvatum TaxID=1093900 RepID=A0A507B1J1_9PEZI|nr:uncharacterized protein E0L32_006058 [Thyridium curvatum]TPX13587.1 hypothetical protein E0L32_006058 [Thyridium curvatum]
MESHMDRFRVRLPSAVSTHSNTSSSSAQGAGATAAAAAAGTAPPSSTSAPHTNPAGTPLRTPKAGSAEGSPAIPPPPPSAGRIIACDRCRHFKKKCSKTPPECTTCAAAGLKCSLATVTPASTSELRARLAWVESFINQRHLLGKDQSIQQLPTGTDLGEIADRSGAVAAAAMGPSPSAAGSAGAHSHDSPTLSFRSRGGRRLDDDSSMGDANSPNGPPVKRKRLESLSASGDRPSDDAVLHVLPERPEEQTGRTFVDAYFRDVNRAYPFVDRNRILATLEAEGGRVFSMKERDADSIIVYLVMAIGYTTLQRAGQVSPNMDLTFEVEYKEVLSECLIEETFDTVQILLLLAIYSISDPRGFSTRPIVDMLARQAIRLGLTQRDLADKGLTPTEIERNHRLFWSIYVLDRMVAASAGMPVALNDANMNVPLPGIMVEEFSSPDCNETMSMLQVARHIIQLRKLEDKVIHQVHLRERASISSLTHSDRRSIVTVLRTEIEDWYSNGCLLRSSEVDNVRIHIRISWLAARYYNLLLLLYYPSHFNPTSSLISKGELLSITQKHVQSNAVRFQHRQLPLNHITLCRLLHVCMIFLHCFLYTMQQQQQPGGGGGGGGGDQAPPLPIAGMREEVDITADMMEAYAPHYTQAHRATAIMRQLSSIIASSTAAAAAAQQQQQHPPPTSSSTMYDPTGRYPSTTSSSSVSAAAAAAVPSSATGAGAGAARPPVVLLLTDPERAWVHAMRAGLAEVTEHVLGRGSVFRIVLDEGDELTPGGCGTGGGLDRSSIPNGPLTTAPPGSAGQGGSRAVSASASASMVPQQQHPVAPQPLPAAGMPAPMQQQQQQQHLPPPPSNGGGPGHHHLQHPHQHHRPHHHQQQHQHQHQHHPSMGMAQPQDMGHSNHQYFNGGKDDLEYAMIQAGDGDGTTTSNGGGGAAAAAAAAAAGGKKVSIMDFL